jgi:hypothetical protein
MTPERWSGFTGWVLRPVDAEGVADISRWSSASSTTGNAEFTDADPDKGSQKRVPVPLCDPYQGRERLISPNRWYRFAQPPANICDAFRHRSDRLAADVAAEPCTVIQSPSE